ncbi:hypothetical protein KSF81_09470 [Siccirubricoccus sp. G192]|nr:hypothetical protein [Siccirubricoccus sp. G192]
MLKWSRSGTHSGGWPSRSRCASSSRNSPTTPSSNCANPTSPQRWARGELRTGRADIAISRLEKSLNWSGAYVTPSHGRRLIHAAGVWRVPEPKPRPADAEYACSAWVGLDGYRRWVAGLPQIGTVQSVTVTGGQAGPPVTQSWWQWWVRGQELLPVILKNVPVRPGDEVICILRAMTPDLVRFHIKNRSSPGVFATIQVLAPKYQPEPNGPFVTARVLGTTAEWIMERPTVPGSARLYPLPDYGTVEFADCVVRSRHPPAAARRQLLRGAGLIRMYEMLPNPSRVAVISVPKKLDQRTAEVRCQQR